MKDELHNEKPTKKSRFGVRKVDKSVSKKKKSREDDSRKGFEMSRIRTFKNNLLLNI